MVDQRITIGKEVEKSRRGANIAPEIDGGLKGKHKKSIRVSAGIQT
jgi:hypothetical protein